MNQVKEFLSGKKIYILMALGALVALFQFATGVSLGIPDLPVATDYGTLIQEIYAFAVGAAARAALAK